MPASVARVVSIYEFGELAAFPVCECGAVAFEDNEGLVRMGIASRE